MVCGFENGLLSPYPGVSLRVQSFLRERLWNTSAFFVSVAGVNRGYAPAGDIPIPCRDRCEKGLHSVVRTSVVLDIDHAAVFERRANWCFRYFCPSKFCRLRFV